METRRRKHERNFDDCFVVGHYRRRYFATRTRHYANDGVVFVFASSYFRRMPRRFHDRNKQWRRSIPKAVIFIEQTKGTITNIRLFSLSSTFLHFLVLDSYLVVFCFSSLALLTQILELTLIIADYMNTSGQVGTLNRHNMQPDILKSTPDRQFNTTESKKYSFDPAT